MYQTVDSFIHNQQLGRGVNIIGYDPLWKSPTKARFQAKHFKLIREAGFNHVRINLHPFQYMGEAPDYTIHPDWLKTLDWVLTECQNNELLAIVDMHEFKAMSLDPMGLKAKFLSFWKQISERYQDAPQSVLFEVLNEPNTKLTVELWNELLKEPLAIIRKTNPTRTVIIGPAFWNGIDYLHELELPESDRHIIVTVHYYRPMDFTHQGAPWSADNKDKAGITWSDTKEEREVLQQELGNVQAWAKKHNRPIYLGEFGAYDKADLNSRVLYTNAVAREVELLGWSWCYWQFDSDFIVYDIDQDCWFEPILNALIAK